MHDWNDDECINVLKRCKEAITSQGKKGKVIIIDAVINEEEDEHDSATTKLLFDILQLERYQGLIIHFPGMTIMFL